MGANGIDVNEGITDSDWEVVQVKKAMIKSASKVAFLCISEKLNSVKKMRVCGLRDINYLITETDTLPDSFRIISL